MDYSLEANKGRLNLYSERISSYIMEDASPREVKLALVTEMEYKSKLEILRLLMTFPHGLPTMNGEILENQAGLEEYENWHREAWQRIAFIDEYYQLIDEKINEVFLRDYK